VRTVKGRGNEIIGRRIKRRKKKNIAQRTDKMKEENERRKWKNKK